ncbi:hypothetical protein NIM87_04015 [Devosia sp. XJ19-1]|uniref:Uncharacterized protein n=1 Tax=Devosia ureilytica TaxID=2952754 RepID=A0A9Q4ANE0_9HYPH|nr:hypothetical protein [Devosia ureilytica]MCP8882653.1 hypothetical protein [Devosia ureilytica]MCP8886979.1 hypothetical protein [Devosia ureilytica]
MVQMMSDLAQSETPRPGLPMVLAPAAPRPSLARSAPAAAFVSQLLAARAALPTQRARRRGTAEGAIGAYGHTARIAERRMPQGYRKTIVA